MDQDLSKKTAQLLSLLNSSSGFFIVSNGSYYCQFSKDVNNNKIIFEVVSSKSIPGLDLDENILSGFGFILKENYSKEIVINSDNDINYYTNEVVQIFQSVFNIKEGIHYSFSHELIGDNTAHKKKQFDRKEKSQTVSKGSNIVTKAALFILFAAIFLYFYGQSYVNDDNEKLTYTQAMYEVKNYLKTEYLKDPDSYQSIKWSDLQHVNNVESENVISYKIMHKFRAKNSFGGYAVEELIFCLNYKGKILQVE